MTDSNFWEVLDTLVAGAEVVVERAAGSVHPRFPETCCPLDDGFLRGTRSGDGAGTDVFLGQLDARAVTGVVATVDAHKRDTELKLLLGCTPAQMDAVRDFLSWPGSFGCVILPRPDGQETPLPSIPLTHHAEA